MRHLFLVSNPQITDLHEPVGPPIACPQVAANPSARRPLIGVVAVVQDVLLNVAEVQDVLLNVAEDRLGRVVVRGDRFFVLVCKLQTTPSGCR
jgi:hypothetical protein